MRVKLSLTLKCSEAASPCSRLRNHFKNFILLKTIHDKKNTGSTPGIHFSK